jgi:hypothetical protein
MTDVVGADTIAGEWKVLPKIGLQNVPFSLATVKIILT